MLGNFSCFLCRLLTFFSKLTFSKNRFRNTVRVSNSLDSDQDQHSVGLDLGPNCLQKLPLAKKEYNLHLAWCFQAGDGFSI